MLVLLSHLDLQKFLAPSYGSAKKKKKKSIPRVGGGHGVGGTVLCLCEDFSAVLPPKRGGAGC